VRRRDRREGEAFHHKTRLDHHEQRKKWGGSSGARDAEMPCDAGLDEKKVKRVMTMEVTTSI
jgi:hypothetical protein